MAVDYDQARTRFDLVEHMIAGGALNPYQIVKLDGTDDNEVVECDASGEIAWGVVVGVDPSDTVASGTPVTICRRGMSPIKAGGSITAGNGFMTSAAGKAIAVTTTNWMFGTVNTAAADGDLVECDYDFTAPSYYNTD